MTKRPRTRGDTPGPFRHDGVARRVSEEHLRAVLQRIDKSGELKVLLDSLRDHADTLDKAMRVLLTNRAIDAETMGEMSLRQGELRATLNIVSTWVTLAKPAPAKLTQRQAV